MENNNGFERENPWQDEETVNENKDENGLTPKDFFGEEENVAEYTPKRESEDRYYEIFEKSKSKSMGWSVASMILGIVSVVCGGFGLAGLICGIIAVVMSVISRVKLGFFSGKSIVGLILGIFGMVFGIVLMIFNSLIAEDFFKEFFAILSEAENNSSGGEAASDF